MQWHAVFELCGSHYQRSRPFLSVTLPNKADDEPVIDPKYEKNATTPSLANPATLKLLPIRVSQLCMCSALL